MRRTFLRFLSALVAMTVLHVGVHAQVAVGAPVNVVYHLLEGTDQASRAMGNIRNHLRAEPHTRIVVVAHGEGIRFLLSGAQERNGKPFDSAVSALAAEGVEFRVCGNTLTAHQIPVEKLLPEAKIVASGVAEIARLQAKEGFVYLRP